MNWRSAKFVKSTMENESPSTNVNQFFQIHKRRRRKHWKRCDKKNRQWFVWAVCRGEKEEQEAGCLNPESTEWKSNREASRQKSAEKSHSQVVQTDGDKTQISASASMKNGQHVRNSGDWGSNCKWTTEHLQNDAAAKAGTIRKPVVRCYQRVSILNWECSPRSHGSTPHAVGVRTPYRVAGKPWALLFSLKTRIAPRFHLLFGRNGPLWEVRGIEISTRDLDFDPLSWFERPLLGGEKIKVWAFEKPSKSHNGSTKHACCLIHLVFASHLRKSAHRKKKNIFFRDFGPPQFFTVLSTICGTVADENEKTQGGSKLGFLDPLTHFEAEGRSKFRFGICVTKQFLRRVLCLRGAVRCLWRVSSSRSCCDQNLHQRALWSEGARNLLLFTLISSTSFLFFDDFTWKKSGCPERRKKRKVEISRAQGHPAHPVQEVPLHKHHNRSIVTNAFRTRCMVLRSEREVWSNTLTSEHTVHCLFSSTHHNHLSDVFVARVMAHGNVPGPSAPSISSASLTALKKGRRPPTVGDTLCCLLAASFRGHDTVPSPNAAGGLEPQQVVKPSSMPSDDGSKNTTTTGERCLLTMDVGHASNLLLA